MSAKLKIPAFIAPAGAGSGTLATHLLAQPLASERLLDSFFLAGFQVERVFLDILDDIFLLHFALESTQRAFERLAIIENHFRQS
jgi:hypothetical protein